MQGKSNALTQCSLYPKLTCSNRPTVFAFACAHPFHANISIYIFSLQRYLLSLLLVRCVVVVVVVVSVLSSHFSFRRVSPFCYGIRFSKQCSLKNDRSLCSVSKYIPNRTYDSCRQTLRLTVSIHFQSKISKHTKKTWFLQFFGQFHVDRSTEWICALVSGT